MLVVAATSSLSSLEDPVSSEVACLSVVIHLTALESGQLHQRSDLTEAQATGRVSAAEASAHSVVRVLRNDAQLVILQEVMEVA